MHLGGSALSFGLSAAGRLLQGVGSLRAGKAAKAQAYADATSAERDGAMQEARIRDAARAAIGDQIASQFSNGFLGGTGSALDALRESQINAALDALTVRRQASAKANALRAEGNAAARAGRMGAVEAMLGGAADVVRYRSDWAAARTGLTASHPAYARTTRADVEPMSETGGSIRWSPPATRGI